MTLPAAIAEIAARHDIAYSDRRHSIVKAFKNAHNDRGALLRAYRELAGELEAVSKSFDAAHAEVEQLTQERDEWRRLQHKAARALGSRIRECDRLRGNFQFQQNKADSVVTLNLALEAERDRLRASNEKLQRALRDIYKSEGQDSLSLEDWQGLTLKLQRKAMAALVDAQRLNPEYQPIDAAGNPVKP